MVPRHLKRGYNLAAIQTLVTSKQGHKCDAQKAERILEQLWEPLMMDLQSSAKALARQRITMRIQHLNLKNKDGLVAQSIKQAATYWCREPFGPDKVLPIYLTQYGSYRDGKVVPGRDQTEDDEFEESWLGEYGLEYWDEKKEDSKKITKSGQRTKRRCGFARGPLATHRANIRRTIDPAPNNKKIKVHPFNVKDNEPSSSGLSLKRGKADNPQDLDLMGRKLYYNGTQCSQLEPKELEEVAIYFKGYKGPMGSLTLPKTYTLVPEHHLMSSNEDFMRWVNIKQADHTWKLANYGKDKSGWDQSVAVQEYDEFQQEREKQDRCAHKVVASIQDNKKDGSQKEHGLAELSHEEFLKKFITPQMKLNRYAPKASKKQSAGKKKRKVSL